MYTSNQLGMPSSAPCCEHIVILPLLNIDLPVPQYSVCVFNFDVCIMECVALPM